MKTIGLARLGRDAEVRFTPGGDAVCNLSLAVNYGQKGQDGNRPTQWIDASLWGKRAEALWPYLLKGTVHCFTLDEVHIEEYEGKNGKGTKLHGRVTDVELGPRIGDAPAGGGQQQRQRENQMPGPGGSRPPAQDDFDDSDIPF
jgi:single-strand DNA-binding protein